MKLGLWEMQLSQSNPAHFPSLQSVCFAHGNNYNMDRSFENKISWQKYEFQSSFQVLRFHIQVLYVHGQKKNISGFPGTWACVCPSCTHHSLLTNTKDSILIWASSSSRVSSSVVYTVSERKQDQETEKNGLSRPQNADPVPVSGLDRKHYLSGT